MHDKDFEISTEIKQITNGVAAVDRALTILEAFREEDPYLSLAEISARTGFYKSTILRLIQSLERFTFIVQGVDGRYRIGSGAWRIGMLFKKELRLEERMMPLLTELAKQTGESVAFWIPLVSQPEPMRLCILRVESMHAVSHNFRVGDTLSLVPRQDRELGTTGRVIRAFLFPNNPADEDIRKYRVFSSWGDRDPEVVGIASPVYGPVNELVGALTLSAPTSRRDKTWADSMKPLVLAMSDRATQALGGSTSKF